MKYVLVAMPQVLWFLLTPALLLSQPVPAPAAAPVSDKAPSKKSAPPPGCPSMCGNIHIPYPFGIDDHCAWPGFSLTCIHVLHPPRLYSGAFEVINITLETGEMRVFTYVSFICYNSSNATESSASWGYYLKQPFLISPVRNVFTAIGCNTLAFLEGSNYFTGCITTCVSLDEATGDGKPCAGKGCCQTSSLPSNLDNIAVTWSNVVNNPAWRIGGYCPCSYSFVAEKGWYKFSQKDLNSTGDRSFIRRVGYRSIPTMLDWAITSNGTCPTSPANTRAPACVSTHSHCTNAKERQGYLCNCSKGYSGNPYVTGGCKNINECKFWKLDPKRYGKQSLCKSSSTCRDTEGDYECKCNFWTRGNGRSEKGWWHIFPPTIVAIVAILVALVVLLALLWFILREHKRRQRRGIFDKNGGQLLKKMNINIVTKAKLDKITKNYSKPIGNGHFGKFYLGTTDDNQQVAVKLSKTEAHGNDDFVNEITIQSQISHPNMVRLLGCCLETNVPMLVFEFVANGSLYNALHDGHGTTERPTLSLSARLDIAIGSAEALAFMHSQDASQKILHGDVKSGNILLDDNFQPKVSDFGLSKLLSSSEKKYVRFPIGDIGYMDPVYMKTGLLTEKSDVYSFGVVLLELITGKKARYNGNNSLPLDFKRSYESTASRGAEMLDEKFTSAADIDCLENIGTIAVQCLREYVDERPIMAQVVDDLKLVKSRTCN